LNKLIIKFMILTFLILLQVSAQGIPSFSPENEEIKKEGNSSIFVKWDSLNFYLKYEGEYDEVVLFIGNGTGMKNLKLGEEYVFIKPMNMILFSDGKKFAVKDSMLVPFINDSLVIKNEFFKIPKSFFPETTFYIYFTLKIRKKDSVYYFPEKRKYQFILPVYKVLVDANGDLEWDADIIPKAICEEIYPPEEFYTLKVKISRTIVKKGEVSYFIVSPQEDGYVTVSLFNEMGQKIKEVAPPKWFIKDRDYLIELRPDYENLNAGRYFCVFYFNGYPVLKVPIFLVK